MAQKEVTQPIMKLAQVAFESERPQVLPNPYDRAGLQEEEWRWIPGWEKLYMISTYGKVMSYSKCKERPRLLAPLTNNGYQAVILTHKNRRTGEYRKYFAQIHLMMAKAFLPNPNPEYYTQVNHRSGNRSDNRITNLEWCTSKYNNLHNNKAVNGGLRRMRLSMYFVKLTNSNTGEEKILNSTREAATFLNTHINLVNLALRHMYSSGHNVLRGWKVELTDREGKPVEDEPREPIVCSPYDALKNVRKPRIIIQCDKEGNELNEFNSLPEAEKETGVYKSNISKALLGDLKSAGGYTWKYKED